MNEYDNDELDDYSSANSFRARSNTWPLNKPDLTAPSSNVCIDETLPEIELEEDDLFTTNENWSGGFVDHDIMSWDPILNAQNQQHHQHQHHQASQNLPAVIHHQAQSLQANNHVTPLNDQQLHPTSHQGHQRQQSIHLQQHRQISQQQQQQLQPHQHRSHNHLSPQATSVTQHHAHHQPHQNSPNDQHSLESYLESSSTRSSNELMIATHNRPIHQQPSPHDHQIQHQTLNSSRCLDADDPNEYHIQMHQLRIDGPDSSRQNHYSNVITQSSASNASDASSQMAHLNIHHGHPITEYPGLGLTHDNRQLSHHDPHNNQHHHHSHLRQLTTSRFEYEPQQNDYDLKMTQDDNLNHQHLNHMEHHQHQHSTNDHTNPQNQFEHHLSHHHIQQSHQSQYHDLTSPNLETNSSLGNHMLSSTIGSLGAGVRSDLENLDLKPPPVSILSNNYEEPSQQSHQHQHDQPQQQSDSQSKTRETAKGEPETSTASKQQADATSALKTKLNAQRRNAWGNMSYADLISQAIESTSDKRLTLSQIYDWMVQNVPYFNDKGDSNSSAGWKNSVRHNLSLHSRFKRLQNEGTGKSSWWTINPEANVGKCARRRAASMEASKYEKKRGRAKKRAEAIRQGLVSYPSLTNSSLNGSTNTLGEQQSQPQSLSNFYNQNTSSPSKQEQPHQQMHTPQHQRQLRQSDNSLQPLDQQTNHQQSKLQSHMPQLQIQMLEDYNIDQPSQQQQQHLRQLQQADRQEREQQHSCFSALDFGSNRSADVALGGA